MTQLTADDVLNKKFQPTKFREGYDQDEVDEFLDQIVEAMRDLENENAELKAKLDAANARVAELSEGAPVVTATPVSPVAPIAPVVESPIVETPKIEPSGNNAESAAAMLEMAQRLHDEYVAKGKAERERIVTEARATGEQLTREAENQRNQTLSQLEKERANLEHKIDELRRFESDYRTRLRSYLTNLLNNVEDASGGGQSNLGL
ncbi:MAG: DivIVA domain-containing protein [Actinomyces graevenitzii]|jgi:DivIVA domain|uniref:Cell wall synthesis protein Wag31 n=1 Tax=Actinomyces graevenitzii TaxID=55565 RepID=A0A9E7AED4_9ACTO|nr:DivIVA domain-containing protein [Actinomyces graevenitzii]MBS4942576.1 DivIVA domain-containing protein [Actinomyces graevenitzii]MBS5245249.1 DivIVA domain-containing protein [Actinomyces graevenitzii]MBS6672247.1 DivIVA domain-containing protein [Actinomyces graevenitzii]UQF79043.1 MAG: DivIVA domain-containing protein [Actinomyces graevenitzii]